MNRTASNLLAALALIGFAQALSAQERIATNNTYNEFPRWTALSNAFNVEDGSNNRVLPGNVSMAQDFRNVLHVAGTLSVSGGGNQVFYINNDWLTRRGNGYSEPYQVSSLSSGVSATDVEVAALSDGQVVAFWVQPGSSGNDIRYRTRSASGSWGSITTGITGASGDTIANLRTAPRGTDIHMVFVRTNGSSVKLQYVKPTTSWTPETVSDSAATSANAAGANVAVDSSGNLFVVYEDYPSGGGEYARYRSKASGGTWSSATNIKQNGYSPDVAVDSGGNAHIAHVVSSGADAGKVFHRVGSGGSDVHVGNTTAATAAFDRVRLAVDTRDRPNVVWNTTADLGYAVKVGSSWTRQEPIQEPGRGNTGYGRGTNDWSFGPLDLVINPFDSVTWIDGTSGLVSGMYEPNLGSQDGAAEFHMGPGCTVNGATGNLEFRLPLFSSKGVGFATKFSLLQNSLEADWGMLSNGWSHNYHMYVIDGATGASNNQDSVTVAFPDGSRAIFRYSSTYGYLVADAEYGVFSKLERVSASSSTNWIHSGYLLTTKFGIEYEFREDGKLLSIADTNSNAMLFHYAGDSGYTADSTHPAGALMEIEDSLYHLISTQAGRKTKLAYNSDRQLAYVRDPNSTSDNYSITYDSSSKRLATVTFNGISGITWSFSYHTTNHTSNGYRIGMFNVVKTPRGTAATSPYGSTYKWYQDNRFSSVTDPSVSVITSCTADASPQSDTPIHGLDYTDPTSTFSNPNNALPGNNTVPVVTHSDPCNRTTTIEYQYRRALVDNFTDPLDRYAIFTYDGTYRNLTQAKDKRAYVTKYAYQTTSTPSHVKDNLWKIERPDNAGTGWLRAIEYGYTTDGLNRVNSVTDARSNATTYTYSSAGNLTGVTYPQVTLVNGNTQSASESWTYTTRGRVESWTDAESGVATYVYDDDDATGLVTKILEDDQSSGNGEAYEYDAMGNLKKIFASPNNLSTRVTEFVRDGLFRVTTVKDELTNETVYDYDENSNVVEITNRREVSTSFAFDARDQMTTINRPSPAGDTTFVYDRERRLRRITNGRGFTTVKLYDELGRVAEIRRPGEGTAGGGGSDMVIKYEYDENGNLTSVLSDGTTDRETTFEYDPRNNRKKIDYAVGSLEDGFVYDANDNLLAKNRLSGTTFMSGSAYEYDSRNRIIRRYKTTSTFSSGTPSGVSSKILHDKNGNVTQVWNPNASSYGTADSTGYAYDSRQRLTQTVNGLGIVVRAYVYYEDNSTYRIQGQEPQVGGLITIREFEFSKRGELTRDEDALGYADVFTYDDEGDLLTKTDKRSVVTDYEYWDTDWLKKTTLNVIEPTAMDIVTQYAYDENGNLETVTVYNPATEDNDAVYTRYYDEADRLEKLTNPNTSHYQVWTYNDHGDLATYRDGSAKVTSYSYDALGRATSEAHGTPFNVTITREYYGATGLVTMLDDGTREVNTTYNTRLLPTEVEWVINSTSFKTIEYAYDNASNVTSQSDPDSANPTMYAYDDDNRLETITKASVVYATIEYDAGGRKSELTYYNGNRTTWTYTDRNAIEQITLYEAASLGSDILMQRTYTYDVRGQVTAEEREELFDTATNEYDDAGRLIHEEFTGNSGQGAPLSVSAVDNQWTYDRGGNRLTQYRLTTEYLGVDEEITYTYNSEGLLLTEDGEVHVQADEDPEFEIATIDVDYTYDANGNRTTKDGAEDETYSYDHLNRLASHVLERTGVADQTTNYAFMPTGQRVSKNWVEGSTTDWCMQDYVGIVADYRQVWTGPANQQFLYVNWPNDDCVKITRVDIVTSGAITANYFQDRNCSIVATHTAGVVSRRVFDEAGRVPAGQGTEPEGPGYKGGGGSVWCGTIRYWLIDANGKAVDTGTGTKLAPSVNPCPDGWTVRFLRGIGTNEEKFKNLAKGFVKDLNKTVGSRYNTEFKGDASDVTEKNVSHGTEGRVSGSGGAPVTTKNGTPVTTKGAPDHDGTVTAKDPSMGSQDYKPGEYRYSKQALALVKTYGDKLDDCLITVLIVKGLDAAATTITGNMETANKSDVGDKELIVLDESAFDEDGETGDTASHEAGHLAGNADVKDEKEKDRLMYNKSDRSGTRVTPDEDKNYKGRFGGGGP